MGHNMVRLVGSGVIAASLLVASMAGAATVAGHGRHHRSYARSSYGFGWYRPRAHGPEDRNAFGTITSSEWTTGMQADDWRQSVNGR